MAVLRAVLLLLLGSSCVLGFKVAQPTTMPPSCMVRLFTTAGLSLPRALAAEHHLARQGISARVLAELPQSALPIVLQTSDEAAAAIAACMRRESDECKAFSFCEHSGTCVLENSSYTCLCQSSFTGSFCEQSLPCNADELLMLSSKMETMLFEMRGFKKEWRSEVDSLSADWKKKNTRMRKQLTTNSKMLKKTVENMADNLHSCKPTSCKEIKERDPASMTGSYEIRSALGQAIKVHCEMEREGGGWTRVLHIDPNATGTCPGHLHTINPGRKLCTKKPTNRCSGTVATVPLRSYTQVMGFVTGYKDRSVDAFLPEYDQDIDGAYMDGVSVTRGSPMQHVWSYTAGFRDHFQRFHCPCSAVPGTPPPDFVGNHYYCNDYGTVWQRWTLDGPNHLWSHESECAPGSTCCQNTSRPWFIRNLEHPTSDDIQLRVCLDWDVGNENIGFDKSDIYVR